MATIKVVKKQTKAGATNAVKYRSIKQPKLTAKTAKEFKTRSAKNTDIVNAAFSKCGHKAYQSVFTISRWNAQGFSKKQGEKPTPVMTIQIMNKVEIKEGKEVITKVRTRKTARLFCQCQVNKLGSKTVVRKVVKKSPKVSKSSDYLRDAKGDKIIKQLI